VQQPPVAAPAALRAVQAAYQPPTTPINVPQVAFEIVRQFEAGNSRFQIRLDPAELGRIDVQLDLDRLGNVNARMVVERPETLDLLQRDQRALQQALQQAGLDANRTSLEFSLRQNPFGGDHSNQGQNQGQGDRETGNLLSGDVGAEPIAELYRGSAASGALNLFV
jgi:flagellar hook-length control protein FliK